MAIDNIEKVLVVGAGTMGHGIAQVFARKGFKVTLCDQDPEALGKSRAAIAEELNFLVSEKVIPKEDRERAMNNLAQAASVGDVAPHVDFVIEAVTESLRVKQALFAELDKLCQPGAVLASNTSGISISAIAEKTARPERVVGMHWWNPPYLIPVVEVVRGSLTSDETISTVKEITQRLDKKPVLVNKDIPGFLGNRMQYALMREAIFMLEEGVASAEDIDLMVKAGFGFKFPVMGPLETIDMAGFDIYQKVSAYLYEHICNSVESHRIIQEKISKGEKGLKTRAGFYRYREEELPELLQFRSRKLLALLNEMGYKV